MNELARLLGVLVALRDPSGGTPDLEHQALIGAVAFEPVRAQGVAVDA